MLRNNRGQIATILEIVVVVAMIVMLAYTLLPRYIGGGTKESGGPAAPIERAKGVDCQNNLQQVRYAITMYQQSSERPPASIADLKSSGISGDVTRCPVSGTPYSYDPGQGKVWCTTPGHERY